MTQMKYHGEFVGKGRRCRVCNLLDYEHDEAYVQHLETLLRMFCDSADEIEANWESGDLAGAVDGLLGIRDSASELPNLR